MSPRLRAPLVIGALAALAAFAAWQAPPLGAPANAPLGAEPARIMGTTCRLLAVPPRDASAADAHGIAARALLDAEAELRALEAELSTWIDDSPLSRFNRAPAGVEVPLPPASRAVLAVSAVANRDTDGAFDITCRPLVELWRGSASRNSPPTSDEIDAARARSTWAGLELTAAGARKRGPGVEVDVGGVAKGYAIDRASEAMRAAGAAGGLVDVGGDLRVFGAPPTGATWEVAVQNPFGDGVILSLRMGPGAVCTSGDYFRYVELEGRRYSHIVDPRSGNPATSAHSATVVAPDAVQADIWATALSVLGEAGLARLPAGHEALLVLGEREAPRGVATRGFLRLLAKAPAFPVAVTGN